MNNDPTLAEVNQLLAGMKEELPLYGQGEETTTCPKCGSRTDFIERGKEQVHWCLNEECKFKFRTEPDEEESE